MKQDDVAKLVGQISGYSSFAVGAVINDETLHPIADRESGKLVFATLTSQVVVGLRLRSRKIPEWHRRHIKICCKLKWAQGSRWL